MGGSATCVTTSEGTAEITCVATSCGQGDGVTAVAGGAVAVRPREGVAGKAATVQVGNRGAAIPGVDSPEAMHSPSNSVRAQAKDRLQTVNVFRLRTGSLVRPTPVRDL